MAIITQTCTLNLGNVKRDHRFGPTFCRNLGDAGRHSVKGKPNGRNCLAQALQVADALGAGGFELPRNRADQRFGDDKEGGG